MNCATSPTTVRVSGGHASQALTCPEAARTDAVLLIEHSARRLLPGWTWLPLTVPELELGVFRELGELQQRHRTYVVRHHDQPVLNNRRLCRRWARMRRPSRARTGQVVLSVSGWPGRTAAPKARVPRNSEPLERRHAYWPAASPSQAPQAVSLVLDVFAGRKGFREGLRNRLSSAGRDIFAGHLPYPRSRRSELRGTQGRARRTCARR
jgi:hypothetical protein